MDHHHHQSQWRPRPVQGSICPVCSITHFPFCPPHPQFNPNHRFPSEPVYSRPVFDPYRAPPGMHGDTRNLYRNPNLDAQFHGQFQFPPHREGCGPPQYDYGGSNGFVGEGGDRNFKRLRVDEASPGSGALTNDNYPNSVGVFSEDERRLKLIRDHGGASIAPPHGGPDMVTGVNSGFNREANWNAEMNSFQVPGFGSRDRKGQYLQTKEQYLQSNENGFHSGDFGPNNVNQLLHKSHCVAYPNSVVPTENYNPYNLEQNQPLNPYGTQHRVHLRHDFHSPSQLNNDMIRPSYEGNLQSQYGNQGPIGHQNLPEVSQYAAQMEASRLYGGQPPLPASPPPPLPLDPPVYSSPPQKSSSLFPVTVRSTAIPPSAHPLAHHYVHSKTMPHVSADFATEETQAINKMFSNMYEGEGHPFKLKQLSSDKPKVIDASHLFRQSYRATRPDHIVIILRGLPGSGKSYLAKLLRDLEVENGGNAPRIHSMDDYFMTEVEKDEESDVVNSSSSIRGKKRIMKKVMEYCYEPEMEEGYRSSMLKSFKKTLEEGVFTFVIVDDRNLRVADFAQFWAIGKRSGYEVYILEATYKDPAGCAARNVHGFTQDDIQKMAEQWEEAPPLYLQLDIKSLFQGDDLKESGIQEIDMDMEDEDFDGSISALDEEKPNKAVLPPVEDNVPNGFSNDMKRWDADGEHPTGEVKELGRSKWSDDLDEDDTDRAKGAKSNFNALSGLLQAYAKQGKSVHWGDQLGNAGFSIGAAKKANMLSLVIGPGVGYNLKSNPLPEEERTASTHNAGESKGQSVFQERLRAEHESFKAVFDRRRHRIGGLNED